MAAGARKKLGVVTAATLIAAGLVLAAPGTAQACATETITLRTFHLEVNAPKVAEIGTVITVKVHVTRPAKEDPLGQGIPMERPFVEPAQDVVVGVGLSVGNVFLPGAAITNEDGLAKVKIVMQDYAPANKVVDMTVYAWKVAQQTPCLTVQEDGFKVMPDAFRTTD